MYILVYTIFIIRISYWVITRLLQQDNYCGFSVNFAIYIYRSLSIFRARCIVYVYALAWKSCELKSERRKEEKETERKWLYIYKHGHEERKRVLPTRRIEASLSPSFSRSLSPDTRVCPSIHCLLNYDIVDIYLCLSNNKLCKLFNFFLLIYRLSIVFFFIY